MLSRIALICLTSLFALSFTAFAKPDAKKAVQQAINTKYDDRDTAIVQKDVDGYVAAYTDDVVFINWLGKKVQGLDEARKMSSLFQIPDETLSASHKIKDFSLDKSGKTATVLIVQHVGLSGTDSNNQPFVMGMDEVLRHFWVSDQDGWHIKQERTISIDSIRNGKPFRHNLKPIAAHH